MGEAPGRFHGQPLPSEGVLVGMGEPKMENLLCHELYGALSRSRQLQDAFDQNGSPNGELTTVGRCGVDQNLEDVRALQQMNGEREGELHGSSK